MAEVDLLKDAVDLTSEQADALWPAIENHLATGTPDGIVWLDAATYQFAMNQEELTLLDLDFNIKRIGA